MPLQVLIILTIIKIMENQNNEKAFPSSDDLGVSNEGMTLRDYFAAKALSVHPVNAHHVTEIAQYAYGLADAMLKERSK